MGARPWTPKQDALLDELRAQGVPWVDVARIVGRSAHACRQRTRSRALRTGRLWTPEQAEIVEEMLIARRSYAEIGRRIGRSANAVKVWATRHMSPLRELPRARSLRQVADLMGVDSKAVAWWADQGWLRTRRGGKSGNNRVRLVDEQDLFAFLEDEGTWHLWEAERITDQDVREWVQDVRGDDRWLTLGEVASRYHVVRSTVAAWIERGELPARRRGNHLIRERDLEGFIVPADRPREIHVPPEERCGAPTWRGGHCKRRGAFDGYCRSHATGAGRLEVAA